MHDRNISLGFASSAFVWFVGATLVVVDLFLPADDMGHVGIVVCCGGAVLMIRSMMCRCVKHLERTVFEVGRDAGRAEAGVPLQRVH